MGNWGLNTFGNDNACDWLSELESCSDLSLIQQALERAKPKGLLRRKPAYIEAPDAEEMLAACEVIAWLRGNPGKQDAYTEPLEKWVAAHRQLNAEPLLPLAHRAIDSVLQGPEQSELVALWQETDEYDAWRQEVEDLRSRLR